MAVLKGLGYAGAYLGGTHDVRQITRIIRRAEELAPGWEELVERLHFGSAGGFYLDAAPPPKRPAAARAGGAGCDGPHAAGAVGEAAEGHVDAAADPGV